MIKRIKNRCGMYTEAFRQCWIPGALFFIVLNFTAFLLPIYRMIQAREYQYTDADVFEIYNAWDSNVLALLIIPAAVLMTLIVFRFLNSRASSDFYHALPHKRVTLYCSCIGAVLTWVLILLVTSALLSTVMWQFVPGVNLQLNTILPYSIAIFLCACLACAGTVIAMSLSGTLFTNLLLTAIILFFPRVCEAFLHAMVTAGLPFLVDYTPEISGNLLTSFTFMLFRSEYPAELLLSGCKPYVYTLVLALVYFCIGAWLFYRRRSEIAGMSAPNRIFQHIYRILVTMIYCMFITGVLANDLEENCADWFGYVILYLIGVLIYFTYELITTRKLRNLLTALPGLGIVVLLNGALLLGMHLSVQHLLSLHPSASEIESVSIEEGEYSDDQWESYYDYLSYVAYASRNIEITDPTVISIIADTLTENLETWESGDYFDTYYNYEANYQSNYAYVESECGYESLTVTIRTENAEIKRYLRVSDANFEQIMEILENDTRITDAWKTLPDAVDGTISIENSGYYAYEDEFTEDQLEALLACYQEEVEACSFDTFYSFINNAYYTSYYWDLSITYQFRNGSRSAYITCPVSAELMPKTVQMYDDLLEALQRDEADNVVTRVQEILTSDSLQSDLMCAVYAYHLDENGLIDASIDLDAYTSDESSVETIGMITEYLRFDDPLTAGESYADVYVTLPDESELYVKIPVDDALFSDEVLLSQEEIYYDAVNADF